MRIAVRVIPRSGRNTLEWEPQGNAGSAQALRVLKARLTAPPVDGAANEALVALLAERLDVPRRSISIVHGASSRQKLVEIPGLSQEDLERKLAEG